MIQKLSLCAAVFCCTALSPQAIADTVTYGFAGSGASGTVTLQYGTATDAKYPTQAFEVTGISGTFTDFNIGILNAPITGLQPINYATPETGNTAAPHDFSKYTVGTGLPAQDGTTLTFDNLYWPGARLSRARTTPFPADSLTSMGCSSTSAAAMS